MVKYSEKLFLHLFNLAKKTGPVPDICICGTDLIAQEILKTLHKHGITMHVIADNEISAKNFWFTTHEGLAQIKGNGIN